MRLIDVSQDLNRPISTSASKRKVWRGILTTRHGDGGKAHDLSQEGKRHQADQDRLDDQASDWIFNGKALSYLQCGCIS